MQFVVVFNYVQEIQQLILIRIVAGAPKASFLDRTDINVPGNVYKCKVKFTEKKQNHGCVPLALRTQGKSWICFSSIKNSMSTIDISH